MTIEWLLGDGRRARVAAAVAWAEDAPGAMASNPAGLGFLTGTRLDLSLTGLTGDGEFTNRANTDGRLADVYGVIPDGAVSTRLGPWPVTVGLSVIPESALTADWRYNDTPGGLGGVSYGPQQHRSSILVLRSAVGVGVELTPEVCSPPSSWSTP
jgi:hypothetical protein